MADHTSSPLDQPFSSHHHAGNEKAKSSPMTMWGSASPSSSSFAMSSSRSSPFLSSVSLPSRTSARQRDSAGPLALPDQSTAIILTKRYSQFSRVTQMLFGRNGCERHVAEAPRTNSGGEGR